MRLYVMTGDFMTGKTSWIERMMISAGLPLKSSNPAVQKWAESICTPDSPTLDISGVYTPAVFDGEEKTGIDAVLLPSCERLRFATRRPGFDGNEQAGHCSTASKKLGWLFDDNALSKCNSHLASINIDSCDLLLIDELGPLELIHGGGYTEGMKLLDNAAVTNALVVIRPALLDNAHERWGDFETIGKDSDISELLRALK